MKLNKVESICLNNVLKSLEDIACNESTDINKRLIAGHEVLDYFKEIVKKEDKKKATCVSI